MPRGREPSKRSCEDEQLVRQIRAGQRKSASIEGVPVDAE